MPAGAVATVALTGVAGAGGWYVAGRHPRPAPRVAIAFFVAAAAALAWACVTVAEAAAAVAKIQSAPDEVAEDLTNVPKTCGVDISRVRRAVDTISKLESVPAEIEADAIVVLVIIVATAPVVGAGLYAAIPSANAAPAAGVALFWGVVLATTAAWSRAACDGPASRDSLPADAVYMFFRCTTGCWSPEVIFGEANDVLALRHCGALPPAVEAFMRPGALAPEWEAVTEAACLGVPVGFAVAAVALFAAVGFIVSADGTKSKL